MEKPLQTVMEGKAFYNQHSLIQHSVDAQAVPSFRAGAEAVPVDGGVVIGDFGSSQGRNSLEPIGIVIDAMRSRGAKAFSVYHIDLPSNDFSALFDVVDSSPDTYVRDDVYVYACGRSFYQPILPPAQLTLGWCACAIHWLSASPCPVIGHLWPHGGDAAALAAWQAQAQKDFLHFLNLRARELRVGGQIVVAGGMADAATGFVAPDGALDMLNDAAREMVADGRMRSAEYDRLNLPCIFRTFDQFVAPFQPGGFIADCGARLDVVEATQAAVPTHFLDQYRQDGDAATFARQQSHWMRAWSAPIWRQQLDADRSPAERDAIIDELFHRAETRFASDPERAESRWTQITLRFARTS